MGGWELQGFSCHPTTQPCDSGQHLSEPQLAFHEVGGGGKGQDPPAMRVLTLASVCLFKRNIVFREEASKPPNELFRGQMSCLPIPPCPGSQPQEQFSKARAPKHVREEWRGRPGPGAGKSLTNQPSQHTSFCRFLQGQLLQAQFPLL